MSIELVHATIAFAYVAIWFFIGQTSVRRHAESRASEIIDRLP